MDLHFSTFLERCQTMWTSGRSVWKSNLSLDRSYSSFRPKIGEDPCNFTRPTNINFTTSFMDGCSSVRMLEELRTERKKQRRKKRFERDREGKDIVQCFKSDRSISSRRKIFLEDWWNRYARNLESLRYLDTDTCQINIHETTHIFHDRLSGISRTLHFSRGLEEERSPPLPLRFFHRKSRASLPKTYIHRVLYLVPESFPFCKFNDVTESVSWKVKDI